MSLLEFCSNSGLDFSFGKGNVEESGGQAEVLLPSCCCSTGGFITTTKNQSGCTKLDHDPLSPPNVFLRNRI